MCFINNVNTYFQRLGVKAAADSHSPYLKLKQSNPLGAYRMKIPGSGVVKVDYIHHFYLYNTCCLSHVFCHMKCVFCEVYENTTKIQNLTSLSVASYCVLD